MPQITTLCYIRQGSRYLMLHRIKKHDDINHNKWIGVGGHLEKGESPEECLLREVREETGLQLKSWECRGIITFDSEKDTDGAEYMFLYTSDSFCGELTECSEGKLEWIEIPEISGLELWEGDRIFLDLIKAGNGFFSLKLGYDIHDNLVSVSLDGKNIEKGSSYWKKDWTEQ